MRISIIGAYPYYNTEFYYLRALEKMGHEVVFYNQFSGVPNLISLRSLMSRTRFARFYISKLPVNNDLEEWLSKVEPDIVLIFKGEAISKDTIEKLQEKYPIYLLYPDNFKFPILLRGRVEFFNAIFVTTPMKQFYYKLGAKKVVYLPMAFDPFIHRKIPLQKLYKVSFVGSPYLKRYLLLRKNKDIDVFGPYWNIFIKKAHESVHGEEYIKVINESEININIFHESNIMSNDLSARPFEVLGSGGFLLSENMPLLQNTLPGVPVFTNEFDFKEKLLFYEENPDIRDENSCKMTEILKKKHTYYHRCLKLIANLD